MSNELMLGGAKKAPGDRVRISCDWGNEPLLIQGYAIVAYDVTCSGVGAATVANVQLDYSYQTSALVSGGSVGTYDLVFTVTLNDPDDTEYERTGTLEILS